MKYFKIHIPPYGTLTLENGYEGMWEFTRTPTGEKECCNGLGTFGKCGRGTKKGCTGNHCRCLQKDCPNMHYVDCFEHYIHVEHIPKGESETKLEHSSSSTTSDKLTSPTPQGSVRERFEKEFVYPDGMVDCSGEELISFIEEEVENARKEGEIYGRGVLTTFGEKEAEERGRTATLKEIRAITEELTKEHPTFRFAFNALLASLEE